MNMSKVIPVNELYFCLQGEGKLVGVPHILIRFSGCRLRCQFGNSLCDTWYSSWSPEKGKFTLSDIEEMLEANPQINNVMITGGGPTLQKKYLPLVMMLCKQHDKTITLETEGSEFVEGMPEIDLLSLSPKLQSSVPRIDTFVDELHRKVTQRDIDQHEKWRCNYEAMQQLIDHSYDYQLKPVVSNEDDLSEIQTIQTILNIPNEKVYLMPAGTTNAQLQQNRLWLESMCITNGYNYCERLHIIMHGDKRGV